MPLTRRAAAPKTRVKRVTIEGTIIRADGTIVPLGILADSSRRHRLLRFVKGLFS